MSEEKDKSKLEKLQKKIEELEKQKSEYLAGWQRARADFLNYKKEEMERIESFLKYAKEEFILKILPVLDNFETAARQNSAFSLEKKELNEQEKKETKQIIQGFLQIKIQLKDFLKTQGIEEIKSVGERFDPNFHEVVEELEIKDKDSGVIVEEIQKGYMINGRLLRPAKVKVAK